MAQSFKELVEQELVSSCVDETEGNCIRSPYPEANLSLQIL